MQCLEVESGADGVISDDRNSAGMGELGGDLVMADDLSEVEAALERLEPGAVIVELPSNPLLRCVDLPAIAELAHSRGIPLIADDTIGTGINLEALPYADLIFTSLTKSFT